MCIHIYIYYVYTYIYIMCIHIYIYYVCVIIYVYLYNVDIYIYSVHDCTCMCTHHFISISYLSIDIPQQDLVPNPFCIHTSVLGLPAPAWYASC